MIRAITCSKNGRVAGDTPFIHDNAVVTRETSIKSHFHIGYYAYADDDQICIDGGSVCAKHFLYPSIADECRSACSRPYVNALTGVQFVIER